MTVAELLDAMLDLERHPPPRDVTKEDKEDYATRLGEAAQRARDAVYCHGCVLHRGLIFMADVPVRTSIIHRRPFGGRATQVEYPVPKSPPPPETPYPPPGVPEKVGGYVSQQHH